MEYIKARKEFLEGKYCPVTGEAATEVHHIAGCEDERLIDFSNCLAVTREGHVWIHANPEEAKAKGWLLPKELNLSRFKV